MSKSGSGISELLGCLGVLVGLAFIAGCALVAIAVMVWAYHYLFG